MAINSCTFLGRLTRDPEAGRTGSDVSYCRFSIAVDRAYVKEGEERKADFIDCVAWRGTADFVSKWFKKGDMIGVVGSLQTGTYEKDGVKRKSWDILVQQVSFAGKKQESTTQPSAPEGFEPINDDNIPF